MELLPFEHKNITGNKCSCNVQWGKINTYKIVIAPLEMEVMVC